jgi:prolyl-tRNA synthetase
MFAEAHERRDANIERGIDSFDALAAFFAEDQRYPGWAEVQWSKPTGEALDKVAERLKALKLTFRNVPIGAEPASGACVFTGEPAVERILVARAY